MLNILVRTRLVAAKRFLVFPLVSRGGGGGEGGRGIDTFISRILSFQVYYLRDEETHLKKCGYIVHRCKIDNCDWIGKKDELKSHVENLHQEDIWKKEWNFAGSRKFEHNDTSSDEFGKLLVIEKELFWMLSNYDCEKKKLYKSFQYIGPKEAAKRFNYQICLKSSDDRRQFLFKSTMDDDNRNGSDAFESPNCTVIDFSVLKSFSTYSPENKLKYLYTITRL